MMFADAAAEITPPRRRKRRGSRSGHRESSERGQLSFSANSVQLKRNFSASAASARTHDLVCIS